MKNSSNPAKNEQSLLKFLFPLSILPFGSAAASEYGEIRTYLQKQGTPIRPLDMLIAGHARVEGLILVTNHGREFARVPGEYSCAVKPHIRAGGNRQPGIQETIIASLLA